MVLETKQAKAEPLTLTAQEAAAMIPMGINQFRAAVNRGEIPSVRFGRKILIPRRKFLAFINGDEEES
jgi:excisionase family DNA binding protein